MASSTNLTTIAYTDTDTNTICPQTDQRIDSSAGASPPASRIVVVKGVESSLPSLNPFQRKEAISQLGEVTRCDFRRDGTVEVELRDAEEARKAILMTSLTYRVREGGERRERTILVTVVAQSTPKTKSRGVIACDDLRDMADKDIAEELSDVGVIAARRLGKSDSIVLSFASETPPQRVFIGFRSILVRTYVPEPLRCYRCHMFGHASGRCKRGDRCGRCGSSKHDSDHCSAGKERCLNCQGEHPAWSRKCEKYQTEKEIGNIRVKQGVSFPEARRMYQENHPTPSYSHVAAERTVPTQPQPHVSTPGTSAPTQGMRPALDINTRVGDLFNLTLAEVLQFLFSMLPAFQRVTVHDDVQRPPSGTPSTAVTTEAVAPAESQRLDPVPGDSAEQFITVGKGGKPVGTRRGGPAPVNRNSGHAPPPLAPRPTQQTGKTFVAPPQASSRQGPAMGPPPPPPPRPRSRTTSPAARPSPALPAERVQATPPPARRQSASLSPSPICERGDKRPLDDSISPVTQDTPRRRVRVDPPARDRSVSASPVRVGAADFFNE